MSTIYSRDFMRFYTYVSESEFKEIQGIKYPLVNGIPVMHWTPCGYFILDSIQYQLIFVNLCLEELQDPGNSPVEQFDFSLPAADPTALPMFLQVVMSGGSLLEAMSKLTPYAQSLISKDLEDENIDIWTIIDRRAGVITDRYLGRTLRDAIEFKPEIYQPYSIETDDGTIEYSNLSKCSIEDCS